MCYQSSQKKPKTPQTSEDAIRACLVGHEVMSAVKYYSVIIRDSLIQDIDNTFYIERRIDKLLQIIHSASFIPCHEGRLVENHSLTGGIRAN